MPPTECHHCGATIRNQTARFCEFCGTELVREEAPRMQTPYESRVTRFQMLRQNPELERWLAHRPQLEAPPQNRGLILAVPVVAVFLFFFLRTAAGVGASGVFFVVPVVMLIAVGLAVAKSVSSSASFHRSKLRTRPAIVVDERTKVSGGGKNSSARTRYFVTLEFEGGARTEYGVGPKLAGTVTEGDAGVAYLKGTHLAAFRRVSV